MNPEVSPSDILFGASILIIFLVCAFGVGRLLSAWKNRRFTAAWASLVPLINGTVHHDGGGAATSWLTGTYRGKRVKATIMPGRNRYTEGGGRYNYFDVALLDIPGQQNWRIVYQTALLGLGHTGWDIKTEDQILRVRLEEMGIMAELARLGTPTIEYSAQRHTLLYSEDITPRWVPTPERFQEALEMLLRFAAERITQE
jgi:hypothetical protein